MLYLAVTVKIDVSVFAFATIKNGLVTSYWEMEVVGG